MGRLVSRLVIGDLLVGLDHQLVIADCNNSPHGVACEASVWVDADQESDKK
jgi:hypothetical protein